MLNKPKIFYKLVNCKTQFTYLSLLYHLKILDTEVFKYAKKRSYFVTVTNIHFRIYKQNETKDIR